MEKEDNYCLPEIYLSPSRSSRSQGASLSRQQQGAGISILNGNTSSDTDQNVWGDTDEEIFVPLVAESTIQEDSGVEDRSVSEPEPLFQDSHLAARIFPQFKTTVDIQDNPNILSVQRGETPGSRQRGETPGSDSPPLVGAIGISSTSNAIGAGLPVTFRPQVLETNVSSGLQSDFVLSSGGNEGYRQPIGGHDIYGSDSEFEDSNWNTYQEEVTSSGQVPVRDEVEGADSVSPIPRQSYVSKSSLVAPKRMERNSPAGLSNPDGKTDAQSNILYNNNSSIKMKNSIRPPVVGQSKENFGQPIRKDLGSTDGEESEDEVPMKKSSPIRDHIEIQESLSTSLGSQSENTDSLGTVLDAGISRGEIQGCETGDDDSAGTKNDLAGIGIKPTFIVGGLMNPRRNNYQGRIHDAKASLPNPTIVNRSTSIEREQFISQPPFYPFISEQEISLTSILSVESTNHPDSSERVTSPSVLSVSSSAASSKRLEWDSGADVGYIGGNPPKEKESSSLSTLERIAIGNYASVLRTEPEGTTQVREIKNNKKGSKQSSRSTEAKRSPAKVSVSGTSNSTSYIKKKSSNFDDKASLPSHSWRYQQYRYKKNCASSSDEESTAKAPTSPVASPRRKPRRKNDSPKKKNYSKGKQPSAGPLRNIARELNNEGKSSSLVDLHPILERFQIRRSSSQQELIQRDLSFSSQNSGSNSNKILSSALTGTGSSTSVATTVYRNIFGKTVRHVDSTVSSSSTLVQTESLLSDSRNSSNEKTLEKTNVKRLSDKATNLKSSDYTNDIPRILKPPDRSPFSSINEQSSPSNETSDVDTPSDMKETDAENVISSSQISEDESLNTKNKDHLKDRSKNICNSQSRKAWESIDNSEKEINEVSSELSTSVQSSAVQKSPNTIASFFENQPFMEDGNKNLQSLSVRLQNRVQSLMEVSSVQKAHDYKKLQEYIEFIGHPSASEEEYNLKQNVAGVILRMFGEIGMEESDSSSGGLTTIHSETSESITPIGSSSRSYQGKNDASKSVASEQSEILKEDMTTERNELIKSPKKINPSKAVSPSGICSDDMEESDMEEMMERVTTPGGTVNLVPYRPPSSSRMYYMNIAQESAESGVEGGRAASALSKPSNNSIEVNNYEQESCSSWKITSSNKEVSVRPTTSSILLPPNRVISSDSDEEQRFASGSTRDHRRHENELTQPTENLAAPLMSNTSFPSWQSEPSVSRVNERFGALQELQQHGPSKKVEHFYQDCRGTLHIAHQPPGYADDQDYHSSESMSDQEYQHNVEDAERSQAHRVSRAAWSSSVSESAYETIRERDRHVDEALASSFEFYSTSPRDARCRGYVSSEAERGQDGDDSSLASESELLVTSAVAMPSVSSTASAAAVATPSSISNASSLEQHKSLSGHHHQESKSSLSGSVSSNRKPRSSQQYYQYLQKQKAEGSSQGSSSTEGDRSSQVEFIRAQKQKHMIKIQKHIHTLERLERDLINELGENPGSERSIHRHVTEGRSSTESDTKKLKARKFLRQTGMAASSESTDINDGVNSRIERYEDSKESRKNGRKDPATSKRMERQLPMAKLLLKKGNVRAVSTDSQKSSPRLLSGRSHLSSDHPSSDYISPGISLVENEIKHLLAMEKWTNQEAKESKDLVKSNEYSRRHAPSFQESAIGTMQREEPRGEEDPRKKQKTQRKMFTNMLPVSKSSEKTQEKSNSRSLGKSMKVIPQRENAKSMLKRNDNTKDVSDNDYVSRRGDGSEERDGIFRIIPVVQSDNSESSNKTASIPKTDKFKKGSSEKVSARKSSSEKDGTRKSSSERVKSLNDGNSRSSKKHKNITLKDFSQMYPSFESGVDKNNDSDDVDTIDKLSVGIQTSASLLCLNESNDSLQVLPANTHTQGIQVNVPISKDNSLLTHTKPNSTCTTQREIQSQESDSGPHNRYQGSQYDSITIANNANANLIEPENIVPRNQTPRNVQNMNCISSKPSEQVIKESIIEENIQEHLSQNVNDSNFSQQSIESQQFIRPDAKSTQKSKHSNISHQNLSNPEKQNHKQRVLEVVDMIPKESHINESGSTEENGNQVLDRQSLGNVTSSTVYYEVPSLKQDYGNRISHQTNSAREVRISSARQQKTRPMSARDGRLNFSQGKSNNSEHSAISNRINLSQKVPEGSQFNSAKNTHSYSKRAMVKDYSKKNKEDLITSTEDLSLEENTVSESGLMKAKNKKPVQFNVSATKINISEDELCSTKSSNPDQMEKGISLQDALMSAHPGYLQCAENRRLQIRMKAALRKQAQEHNHQVLAQVPSNLQTPSTIKRFLYKPEVKPLFTYKDIRAQNARLYQLLPEAQAPAIQGKRGAVYRTNRLMANMYSQRLRKKVLAGKTSHGHFDVITPIAPRRR